MICRICNKEYEFEMNIEKPYLIGKCCSQECLDESVKREEERKREKSAQPEKVEKPIVLLTLITPILCILYYIFVPLLMSGKGEVLYDIIYYHVGDTIFTLQFFNSPFMGFIWLLLGIYIGIQASKQMKHPINKFCYFIIMTFLIPIIIPASTIIVAVIASRKLKKEFFKRRNK